MYSIICIRSCWSDDAGVNKPAKYHKKNENEVLSHLHYPKSRNLIYKDSYKMTIKDIYIYIYIY